VPTSIQRPSEAAERWPRTFRGCCSWSDKSGGRDFDESDETNIHELAAPIGEMLDALRLAVQQPA
jgi:hypothetical protein